MSEVIRPPFYNDGGFYNTGAGGAGGGAEIGGTTYQTVIIDGVEWMSENLDYKWDGLSVGDNNVRQDIPQACYFNNNENLFGRNNKKYGLLYNFPAIQQIDSLINGWHVPTQSELQALYNSLSPNFFRHIQSCFDYPLSLSYGVGVGFNMPPCGFFSGSWESFGSGFRIGSKTAINASSMATLEDTGMDNEGKNRRVSVRLIKD